MCELIVSWMVYDGYLQVLISYVVGYCMIKYLGEFFDFRGICEVYILI